MPASNVRKFAQASDEAHTWRHFDSKGPCGWPATCNLDAGETIVAAATSERANGRAGDNGQRYLRRRPRIAFPPVLSRPVSPALCALCYAAQ